jgi:Zn-dependent membrane protease YugP
LEKLLVEIFEYAQGLLGMSIPEHYYIIGGTILFLFSVYLAEWLSKGEIDFIIRLFRIGGNRGPLGKELAKKMVSAAGEEGIKIDESILDSSFRRDFGEIDYQADSGVLELTEDKADGRSYSSAGLVTLEVGRALQHHKGSPLIYARRILTPVVSVCGFIWLYPVIFMNFIPLWFEEPFAGIIDSVLYNVVVAMVGLITLSILLEIPVEIEAVWRGISAMKKAEVFSAGEVWVIRVFLGIILLFMIIANLIIAFNIFKATFKNKK